jgi:hypothetical protein
MASTNRAPSAASAGPSVGASSGPAQSIGQATMQPDGTIVLQLRAEGPDGTVGDGLLTYRPTDKDYAKILQHLGGLKPGETKPVTPFP